LPPPRAAGVGVTDVRYVFLPTCEPERVTSRLFRGSDERAVSTSVAKSIGW
jgi:hypothetical protein